MFLISYLLLLEDNMFKSLKELKEYIKNSCCDIDYPATLAENLWEEKGKQLTKEHVDKIMQILEKAKYYQSKYGQTEVIESDTLTNLNSKPLQDMYDFLDQEVIALRILIFGSDYIPFKTLSEAEKWLKFESLETDDTKEYRGEFNAEYYIETMLHLKYQKHLSVICNNSFKLIRIRKVVQFISKNSGFDELDVLHYFLIGKKPEFKRYQLTKRQGLIKKLTVEINTADLTKKDFDAFYYAYKREMSTIKRKKLTEEHRKLLEIIQSMDEPPPEKKGKKKYFTDVMEIWNKKYPEKRVESWQCISQLYNRAKEKLDNCIHL